MYLREGVVYCESLDVAPGLYSSAYYTEHSGRLRYQDLRERRERWEGREERRERREGREGGRGGRREGREGEEGGRGELNNLLLRL